MDSRLRGNDDDVLYGVQRLAALALEFKVVSKVKPQNLSDFQELLCR